MCLNCSPLAPIKELAIAAETRDVCMPPVTCAQASQCSAIEPCTIGILVQECVFWLLSLCRPYLIMIADSTVKCELYIIGHFGLHAAVLQPAAAE